MKIPTIALISVLLPSYGIAAEIFNHQGQKLAVYGRVNAMHYFSHASDLASDKSYARLGFLAGSQINENILGYGKWEYHAKLSNSEAEGSTGNKTRLAYAGIQYAKLGSFDFGRNYGVVYDGLAYTDVLPEFGSDTLTNTDNFMASRANSLATFRSNGFLDLVPKLDLGLQLQAKNNDPQRAASKANGNGGGISLAYNDRLASGFAAIVTYSSSNRTAGQNNLSHSATGDKAQAWVSAVKYDANDWYLAAMYGETLNMTPYKLSGSSGTSTLIANKTQNIELVALYTLHNRIKPSVAYLRSKGKDLFNNSNTDLAKHANIGLTYYLSKNMLAYTEYKINLLNKNNELGLPYDDIISTSMSYTF